MAASASTKQSLRAGERRRATRKRHRQVNVHGPSHLLIDLIRHLVSYGADVNEMYPQVCETSLYYVTGILLKYKNVPWPQHLTVLFIFQTLNYTALDIAVSRPLTYQNLELIRALLECGADATHRLKYDDLELKDPLVLEIPGPTLLHAVLAKKSEADSQEEVPMAFII